MNSRTFVYNNFKYQFSATVGLQDDNNMTPLIAENLGLFEYVNEMNNLNLTGYLEYTDTDCRIDRLMDQTYPMCSILFNKLNPQSAGDIGMDKIEDGQSIVFSFHIVNFEILENSPGKIKYRLHLLSPNWTDCKKAVNYSNYAEEPQSVTNILKTVFSNAGLTVDGDSFDKNASESKIQYITSGNDDVYSTMKHLLNKLFYSDESFGLDSQLRGVVYNEYDNKFYLFSPGTPIGTFQKSTIIQINQITNRPAASYSDKVNIAYTLHNSKSSILETLFPNKVYHYNIMKNTFSDEIIDSSRILTYFNSKETENKFSPLKNESAYMCNQPMWNNSIEIYDEQMENLMHDGLIVNSLGCVGIIPGWQVSINMDYPIDAMNSSNKKHIEDMQKSYKSISGQWYVSRVQTFVNCEHMNFRQNLTLMRTGRAIKPQ